MVRNSIAPPLHRSRRRALVALVVFTASLSVGCGGTPQIAGPNRQLINSLRTAVNAQNPEWLALNATLIDERHADGTLTDDEYAALYGIVAEAQRGEWEAAIAHVERLSEGQKWDKP